MENWPGVNGSSEQPRVQPLFFNHQYAGYPTQQSELYPSFPHVTSGGGGGAGQSNVAGVYGENGNPASHAAGVAGSHIGFDAATGHASHLQSYPGPAGPSSALTTPQMQHAGPSNGTAPPTQKSEEYATQDHAMSSSLDQEVHQLRVMFPGISDEQIVATLFPNGASTRVNQQHAVPHQSPQLPYSQQVQSQSHSHSQQFSPATSHEPLHLDHYPHQQQHQLHHGQQQYQHHIPTHNGPAPSSLADAWAFDALSEPSDSKTPQTSQVSQQTANLDRSTRSVTSPKTAQHASGAQKRLSPLDTLDGVARTVSQPEDQLRLSTPGVEGELMSEPATPPLPSAKALLKPTSAAAAKAPKAESTFDSKIRPLLSRSVVERDPAKAARDLIQLLSELDTDGRFRKPVPTNLETRKLVLDNVNAIANLEKGKGFSETGRRRYFHAWVASPAGRSILASWIRQTVRPKKPIPGVPDISKKYKDTLHPLLNILDALPMTKDYLTDESAKLGAAITGVIDRAEDNSARKLAEALRTRWVKLVDDGSAKKPVSTSAASSSSATITSNSSSAAAKRKASGDADIDSTKRYRSADTRSSSTVKTATSTTNKPSLAFFSTGATTVKPTNSIKKAMPKSTTTTATSAASKSATSRSGSLLSVHNFVNSLTGTSGTSGSGAGTGTSSAAAEGSADGKGAKSKMKRRVRWKDDSELVAIKLIEPADYGVDDEQHAALMQKGLVGLEQDEGDALRHAVSMMEEQIDWYEPRPLVLDEQMAERGTESVEGPFQQQRAQRWHEDRDAPSISDGAGSEPAGSGNLANALAVSDSPDESNVNEPGNTAEAPVDLQQAECRSFCLPEEWEDSPRYEGQDAAGAEQPEWQNNADIETEREASADANAAVAESQLRPDVGGLLASLGASRGQQATSDTAGGGAAATPNVDFAKLQDILQRAKMATRTSGPGDAPGSGSASAALASAAAAGAPNSTISSLLANLSSTLRAQVRPDSSTMPGTSAPPTAPAAYWQSSAQQQYQQHGGQNGPHPQESYPGEFNPDYAQDQQNAGSHQYQPYPNWNKGGPNQHAYGSGGVGSAPGPYGPRFRTKPCKFYAMGTCHYGDSCHFRHD
ncbi:hypothetical protein BCV70DRAFT_26249 [Testicularia cyperi]|uniref:C3H1-type domain-containing protein n=1 Tax=Testicularia cyperi TaxID=1882483 RepID=A0A317XKX6_9BASI|nr:hypothetical protein BCV70DRAFT_26249 [Testicularia cyperi]